MPDDGDVFSSCSCITNSMWQSIPTEITSFKIDKSSRGLDRDEKGSSFISGRDVLSTDYSRRECAWQINSRSDD